MNTAIVIRRSYYGINASPKGQPPNDAKRRPSPTGGYFSTAHDMAAFGTLILNGGVHQEKRLVSEASVRQLTSTQAGAKLNDDGTPGGYGLGFSTTTKSTDDAGTVLVGACGHGGAYATNLWIDPVHGVVLIYFVQHDGFVADGGKAKGMFEYAAMKKYGTKGSALRRRNLSVRRAPYRLAWRPSVELLERCSLLHRSGAQRGFPLPP